MDLLREMGGVAFVYNLSKSIIVHSDVKETALFTLGTLAEANGKHVCVTVAEYQFRGACGEEAVQEMLSFATVKPRIKLHTFL